MFENKKSDKEPPATNVQSLPLSTLPSTRTWNVSVDKFEKVYRF